MHDFPLNCLLLFKCKSLYPIVLTIYLSARNAWNILMEIDLHAWAFIWNATADLMYLHLQCSENLSKDTFKHDGWILQNFTFGGLAQWYTLFIYLGPCVGYCWMFLSHDKMFKFDMHQIYFCTVCSTLFIGWWNTSYKHVLRRSNVKALGLVTRKVWMNPWNNNKISCHMISG